MRTMFVLKFSFWSKSISLVYSLQETVYLQTVVSVETGDSAVVNLKLAHDSVIGGYVSEHKLSCEGFRLRM